ncbi:type II toxin-antitoxin system RelE family toxin [Dyadobacter pollutisoli]|uniref:Type II toxin-antitoxin system RelE/ParE family toxin n=1 Tax=Dyadobacter pollutisoli TaxID=2910158 RepID=A0A9E8SJA3_9BACT|nr:type II toxin-antitoxin system RelE/ParE family toxin [Dyadobacter pollutisoli]WAC09496.1 type II toxin-antitoxin system RelE/ParE family toxin [Dyadobacter pollutisoli]
MVVLYVKRFQKDLKGAHKNVQKRVFEVIEKLENAQSLETSGVDCKKMEGQKSGEHYYRIRVGDWRIGIEYIHPDVTLLRVLSRGDMYKSFPPKS